MKNFVRLAASLSLCAGLLLVGCGQEEDMRPAAPRQAPAAGADDHGGHAHDAPHGGELVELGDHFANMEILLNQEENRLTLYFLDGHAANPIRLPLQEIPVHIKAGEKEFTLALEAQASNLTGEKVGDTSEFSAVSPDLAGVSEIEGRIENLTIRGTTFQNIEFDHHAH